METIVKEPKTKSKSHERISLADEIDAFKKQLNEASQHSKDAIRSMLDSCTANYNKAIETNREYMKEMQQKLKESEVDTSFFDEITNSFTSSLEVSEEVIDEIIKAHLRRVQFTVDFHQQYMEALKESNMKGKKVNIELFFRLSRKNFEKTIEMYNEEMKKIIDVYNRHLNFSMNFNKRFSKNISSQVNALLQLQTKGLQAYTNMVAKWWKE